MTSKVSVPFTSGSSLQLYLKAIKKPSELLWFQFPLHRDPRCNLWGLMLSFTTLECFSSLYIGILAATFCFQPFMTTPFLFQFPLHRDPRCNSVGLLLPRKPFMFQFPLHRDPRCNYNAVIKGAPQIKAMFQFPLHRDPRCNKIYIIFLKKVLTVSVPFTSGSSLQRVFLPLDLPLGIPGFSSLYIGILAATLLNQTLQFLNAQFQFPLHRDPRCNHSALEIGVPLLRLRFSSLYIGILAATSKNQSTGSGRYVSVPFTSGSSLQLVRVFKDVTLQQFQFPLHRDPRCNTFTRNSTAYKQEFQFPLHRDPRCNYWTGAIHSGLYSFSSLYIGILAATCFSLLPRVCCQVSVPFTSGSSLQLFHLA